MNRRTFLQTAPAWKASAAQAPRRNAVLLYCEQFQHDVASFAAGPARAPNLERLAAGSVRFETACTTTALCSPNRAGLFTGRLGHRTGLDDNCGVWHSRLDGLELRHTTLIEWARQRDIFTGYFGKWHLGLDGPIRRGAHRYSPAGFDRNRTSAGKSGAKPDFNAPKKYYGRQLAEKPGFYTTAKGAYETSNTGQLANQARGFVAEAAATAKPFFLTVGFNAVHPPYDVPHPYNTLYPPSEVKLPASLQDSFSGKPAYQNDIMWPFHDTGHLSGQDWRRAIAYYYGFVTMLDRAVGEIVDSLRENQLLDDTMIIVVADHGDMAGAHNRFDKGPYSYDEVMRIPLLIRAPGLQPRSVSRHVSSIDVNRTLVDWLGLDPDTPPVDSRSLLPLMERGDAAWTVPDEAFYRYEWYNGLWFGIRAIRTRSHKYCFNPCGVDELYHLASDPAELTNLAGLPQSLEVQRSLQIRLLDHLQSAGDQPAASRLKSFMENS